MELAPLPPPAPLKYEGLFATAGLPVLPAAPDLLAIAVGKTNEGESLPAKPAEGGVQRGQLLELLSRKLPITTEHRNSDNSKNPPSFE